MPNPHYCHSHRLLVVTAPPDPLITLSEAKDHLEIDHTDRDTYITSLVAAASSMLDGYDGMVGKAIGDQRVTVSFREPSDVSHIDLAVYPVKSIVSVTYYDTSNVEQSLNVFDFKLVSDEDYAYIEVNDNVTMPAAYDRADAYTFELQCGFSETPEPIKQAVKLIVGHWFNNREAASERSIKAIYFAIDAIVGKYKKGFIA